VQDTPVALRRRPFRDAARFTARPNCDHDEEGGPLTPDGGSAGTVVLFDDALCDHPYGLVSVVGGTLRQSFGLFPGAFSGADEKPGRQGGLRMVVGARWASSTTARAAANSGDRLSAMAT